MANTENMSKKGLKEQTYLTLKERMVDCVYPPGSLINEAQLAADLNLSRTPIREAISKLEMEGFVQILPKKGIYVTNITFNDVIQVFQTRLEIEPISLKLAAPHLPKEGLTLFCQKFILQDPCGRRCHDGGFWGLGDADPVSRRHCGGAPVYPPCLQPL